MELLDSICRKYNLGQKEHSCFPLEGGFLHKTYALFTEKGKFAVKLLNPNIMQRNTAMANFQRAEKLETILESSKIPIVPALLFEGKKMQNIGEHYFYLYEFYDGKSLANNEITAEHCKKIGNILARIHQLGRHAEDNVRNKIDIDWDCYIEQLAIKNQDLSQLLKNNRDILLESQNNGNLAIKRLPNVVCICHNDMDSKNVLWRGGDCRLIDLESLDFSSPYIKLFELALCWSGYEACNIDFNLFRNFMQAYAEAGGNILPNFETLYWSNFGRLEWLEYNVKRVLGSECSPAEIDVGISEVKKSMAQIIYYRNIKEELLNYCNAI